MIEILFLSNVLSLVGFGARVKTEKESWRAAAIPPDCAMTTEVNIDVVVYDSNKIWPHTVVTSAVVHLL